MAISDESVTHILASLPGKDCGQCGVGSCAALAALAVEDFGALRRCVHLAAAPGPVEASAAPGKPATWQDALGRPFDLVLEQFPDDPGPREIIVPFNSARLERLALRQGDVVFGRPAAVGCPVTHVGVVMSPPSETDGTLVWCVVGPMAVRGARAAVEVGLYSPLAYEGLVRHARADLEIGRRYFFLPRTCVLQSRHSGVIAALAGRAEGMRVRLEGIWIA
jgi:uncharacterized Fe-S cluster-containing protein